MEQKSTTRAQKVLPGVSEVVAGGDRGTERCEGSGLDLLRGIVCSSGTAPHGECANIDQTLWKGTLRVITPSREARGRIPVDQSGAWLNSEPDHGYLHHPWDGLRLHTFMVAKIGVGAHRTRW